MGTWGTAIFSDDLAADIRDDWRDAIGEGLTPEAATASVLAQYASALDDPYEASVVWLALAVAQWTTGRVVAEVRDRAVQVIDAGTDLPRWAAASRQQQRRRVQVLAATRAKLLSPPPPARRIRRYPKSATPFVVGDVFGYRQDTGQLFLFWVSRLWSDQGGVYTDAELLDFVGLDLPPLAAIVNLPAMAVRPERRRDGTLTPPRGAGFCLLHASRLPAERVTRLGNWPRPPERPQHAHPAVFPRELDDFLRPFLPGGSHRLWPEHVEPGLHVPPGDA